MNLDMFSKDKINSLNSEINRLCEDIKSDIDNNVNDGVFSRIIKIDTDESYVYDFLKNEGYNIAYNDFTAFMQMVKELVAANPEVFEKKNEEAEIAELSDDDLSEVAGGIPRWLKNTLIAVGAVVAVAAAVVIIVATAGVASVAVGATIGGLVTHVAAAAATTIAVAGAAGAAGTAAVIAGVVAEET